LFQKQILVFQNSCCDMQGPNTCENVEPFTLHAGLILLLSRNLSPNSQADASSAVNNGETPYLRAVQLSPLMDSVGVSCVIYTGKQRSLNYL
jgi:hypothetical protein